MVCGTVQLKAVFKEVFEILFKQIGPKKAVIIEVLCNNDCCFFGFLLVNLSYIVHRFLIFRGYVKKDVIRNGEIHRIKRRLKKYTMTILGRRLGSKTNCFKIRTFHGYLNLKVLIFFPC